MKVTLMGLEFFINNLGCEALSYSFVSELYSIANARGEKLEISTIVFVADRTPYIPGTDIPIRCIKIKYKSKAFWKTVKKEFKDSDYIFDFTMGDSFSDLYGLKRFVLDALVKTAAIKSGTTYILGPQTYGPYKNFFVRKWAKWILKKATSVYTRDEKSLDVARKLSNRDVTLTTDVAFALPFEREKLTDDSRIKVGINPSGLLWNGGYTGNNQFGLTVDYQEYIWSLCKQFDNDRFDVYLIPHVGTTISSTEHTENDSYVCNEIKKKYGNFHMVDDIKTPMDAKGKIAAMDVFIGARMHATIGAFSSGVATIPVSYSRKFEGLYESLNYDYLVHACQDTTEEAVDKTVKWVNNYKELEMHVKDSQKIIGDKQRIFRECLIKDLENTY